MAVIPFVEKKIQCRRFYGGFSTPQARIECMPRQVLKQLAKRNSDWPKRHSHWPNGIAMADDFVGALPGPGSFGLQQTGLRLETTVQVNIDHPP
jgi:hypothetical protein